ncbi:hypothetical protein OH491_27610 (plasmid) [Termitidicoccus mucosus]|uniref:hypothetical protein n=1 Tax=Termitidicoccus mucosus TaxID=1184151 RepID=UPI00318399C2
MTPDDTLFDAYVHLRDRIAANDGEVLEFMSKISEAEITHFIKDPQTAHGGAPCLFQVHDRAIPASLRTH